MKDTFDFTSYVRSGRLHESSEDGFLNVPLLRALKPYEYSSIVIGGPEWYKISDLAEKVAGYGEEDLQGFLSGDFGSRANIFDYAEALDIEINDDIKFTDEEPHQTTDTYVGPRGIEEIIKEILGKRLSEIQMGFEYNPKSVTGTGAKRGPKPIAFPYYELKEKFPEHFRLQTKDKEYTMLVSRDVIEAIGQLKDAGRNARSRQLTKLQDELRSLDSPTKRVLIKGAEGQKTFPVMGKEMYIVNWPIMGPNKTKEFLWLNPTQKEFQEGLDSFQIDENYLD
jgi:hypothetical protein